MPNFLSEDNIEQAMVQCLQHLYGYDAMDCYTSYPANVQDGPGRADKREKNLRGRLKGSAVKLKSEISETTIDDALDQVCDRRRTMATIAANRKLNGLIRGGVRVEFKDAKGARYTPDSRAAQLACAIECARQTGGRQHEWAGLVVFG